MDEYSQLSCYHVESRLFCTKPMKRVRIIRIIASTVEEIQEILTFLQTGYDIEHSSPRRGRGGDEYLCYVNSLQKREQVSTTLPPLSPPLSPYEIEIELD